VSRAVQRIETGYAPRVHQRQIHERMRRFNVLVCHRRFGKTVLCINALIDAALRHKGTDGRFAYIAPTYGQAKDVAWEYLKRFALTVPGTVAHETELRVDFPTGARVRLYGADNPDRLRGLYLDGVVLDEYADMRPRLWSEVIRPALSDREGWAVFIGTPKGRNEFWRLYDQASKDPDWYAATYKASETGIVAPDELRAASKAMTPEQYAQEWECSFQAAVIGSYYGTQIEKAEEEGRITDVPWEPKLSVETWWDLGFGDATAIWFAQRTMNQIRIIDYYENSGQDFSHYAKVLKERPYVYGDHIMPHDADIGEIGGGRRIDVLKNLGIRPRVLPRAGIDDGINAVRLMLPRCWFDVRKTARGLECLRQYRREYNDKTKDFSDRPLHDWTSHAADAIRTGAMGSKDTTPTAAPRIIARPASWQGA